MTGLLMLSLALLAEPSAGDWRVVKDDPGNTVLAVETSHISGPRSRRAFNVAVFNGEAFGDSYLFGHVVIDCEQQMTTLLGVDVKALDGSHVGSLSAAELGAKPAPTSAGAPSVVALVCDGAPMTTEAFPTDVAFISWAVASSRR